MPRYSITGPDGKNYSIDGPAGASREEVIAAIQQQMESQTAKPTQPKEETGILRRAVGDPLVGLAQGVVGAGEAAVGIADIPTFGAAGKALSAVGYDPKGTKEFMQEWKSPEQQAAERKVQEAQGFTDTITTALQNPSSISNVIAESLPSMIGGAAIGKKVLGAGAAKVLSPAALGGSTPGWLTGLAGENAGAIAAGIGEGAVSAGSTAEQARQGNESGFLTPQQAAVSALSGTLTGALGVLGGKVAGKLGIDDVDVLMTGGVSQAEKGSILAAAIKGALSESVFEELPQSMQEQIAANINSGKPWDEGVAEAGAMGVLAAVPMGGGAAGLGRYGKNNNIAAAKDLSLLHANIADEDAMGAAMEAEKAGMVGAPATAPAQQPSQEQVQQQTATTNAVSGISDTLDTNTILGLLDPTAEFRDPLHLGNSLRKRIKENLVASGMDDKAASEEASRQVKEFTDTQKRGGDTAPFKTLLEAHQVQKNAPPSESIFNEAELTEASEQPTISEPMNERQARMAEMEVPEQEQQTQQATPDLSLHQEDQGDLALNEKLKSQYDVVRKVVEEGHADNKTLAQVQETAKEALGTELYSGTNAYNAFATQLYNSLTKQKADHAQLKLVQESTQMDPAQKQKLIAEIDARIKAREEENKQLQEAQQQSTAEAPQREQAATEAEQQRVEEAYPVKAPVYSNEDVGQDTIDAYEETRLDDKGTKGKDRTLPKWGNLSQAEQSLYNLVNKQAGPDEALNALKNFRANGTDTPPNSYFYEANRQAAIQEHSIDFPGWAKLSDSAKNAFLASFPTDARKELISGQRLHEAFGNVAGQLEEEGVAMRGKSETDIDTVRMKEQNREVLSKKQQEIKAENKAAKEAVGKGEKLSEDVLAALTNGDLNEALAILAERARGVKVDKGTIAGKDATGFLINTLINFRQETTSAIFRSLAKSLAKINFTTKVVMDPNNETVKRLVGAKKLAAYSAKTDTLYLTQNGLDEATLLHELVHAGTVKLIHQYLTNPDSLSLVQREALDHLQKIYDFAQKRLGNKYANAFKDMYEFVGYAMTDLNFQHELANIQARPLVQYTTRNSVPLWKQFTTSLAKLYGLAKQGVTKLELHPELYKVWSKEFFKNTKNKDDLFRPVNIEDLTAGEQEQVQEAEDRLIQNLRTQEEMDLFQRVFDAIDANKVTGAIEGDLVALNKSIAKRLAAEQKKAEKAKAKEAPHEQKKIVYKPASTLLSAQRGYEGNALLEISRILDSILAAPEGGIDIDMLHAAATGAQGTQQTTGRKKAGNAPTRTIPDLEGGAENQTSPLPKTKMQHYWHVMSNMFTAKGMRWAEFKFQNDRAAIKHLQKYLERAGKLITDPSKAFNNIYDYITESFGKAQMLHHEYLIKPFNELNEAVKTYTEATGLNIRQAMARMGLYSTAMHERERRAIKFWKYVPLSHTLKITNPLTNKQESAANVRQAIFDALANDKANLDPAKIAAMRATMAQLTGVSANPDGTLNVAPSQFIDKTGGSFKGASKNFTTNIQDDIYRVSHLTWDEVDKIKQHYASQGKVVQDAFDKMTKALQSYQKATIKLNTDGFYWTKQVNNYKDFYGFNHYVPLKGTPNQNLPGEDEQFSTFDTGNIMLSNELKQSVQGMDGRTSESQNPILQTIVDGTIAASRAGRVGLTQAVANSVGDEKSGKPIRGKVTNLTFEQRSNLSGEDLAKLKNRNVILNYKEDGSMDVIQVHLKDVRLLEAIRRPFKESHPIKDMANAMTSAIGQQHTRFNPGFALKNFNRDILANAFIMSAEGKPTIAAKYLARAAKNVTVNFPATLKIARLFHNNDIAGMKALASTNKYAADLLEYMEHGGRVAYAQALSVQGGLIELNRQIGRGGVVKTLDQMKMLFDIWNDTFELTARVSAYSLFRDDLNNSSPDKSANAQKGNQIHAAAYVKNLANFEQIGQWGDNAGAMFMYFRASATGAVRAIESIAPMARHSWETIESEMPETVFGKKENGVWKQTPEQKQAYDTYKKNYQSQQISAAATVGSLFAFGAAVYMMAAAASGDDDDDRNYVLNDDMARWTRFARFSFGKDANGEPLVFQLPWGFGLGAFSAAGAQVAAMSMSPTTTKMDALNNLWNIGLDSFLPIPFSRMSFTDQPAVWLMDSVTPTSLRPFVEFAMNKNSFGQDIYNNRKSRFSDSYTGGDQIPELYKVAAKNMFKITEGSVDWSPNTLYFFANNYIDAISRAVHTPYNLALTLGGEKDFDIKHDTMVLDGYISSQSKVDSRQYYKLEKEIDELSQRLKTMREKDQDLYFDYIDKHPFDEARVREFDKIRGGKLNALKHQANNIRNSDLDPKDKAELLHENKRVQAIYMGVSNSTDKMLVDEENS